MWFTCVNKQKNLGKSHQNSKWQTVTYNVFWAWNSSYKRPMSWKVLQWQVWKLSWSLCVIRVIYSNIKYKTFFKFGTVQCRFHYLFLRNSEEIWSYPLALLIFRVNIIFSRNATSISTNKATLRIKEIHSKTYLYNKMLGMHEFTSL